MKTSMHYLQTEKEDLVKKLKASEKQILNKEKTSRFQGKLNQKRKFIFSRLAVQNMHIVYKTENKNIQTDKYLKMQTDREQHNSMERQRRIELKNEFDKLKSLIPDIAHSDKVSKLNVLNYSAEYVKKLERADLKLKLRKSQLKEKRQKLLDDLRKLGSSS